MENTQSFDLDRRGFLKSVGVGAATSLLPVAAPTRRLHAADRAKLPVAAVVTVYRKMSHADVIIGKILEGWLQDGGAGPDLKLVSMYVDQVGSGDMSRSMSERFGFKIASTIDEAITLGTDSVQVAGVISIGEHGEYPWTPDTHQHMYPRRKFFEQIVAAFRRCGKTVPVFNDKHLAYRWDDAKFMYDTAKQMKFPLLAGSSVPVAWRVPALELDRNDELESALTIGYSGLEVYGFHALEAHQAMIEKRRGGESGIVSVQALKGDAIRKAAEERVWPVDLYETALAAIPGERKPTLEWCNQNEAAVYLLEHRDELKTAVAMVGSFTSEFAFAAKIKENPKPVSTWFRLQDRAPFAHFAQLLKAIEETIQTGNAVYPVERTLLTTGVLDRLMHSLAQNGQRFETPELAIPYQPSDWPFANHPQSRLKLPVFDRENR